MSKEFQYLINYHYFNYVSKIKMTNSQNNTPIDKTFINHLEDILKSKGINNEEIEKRVKELDNSESISQINQELQSIIKNLKFKNFEINLGITEEDFSKVKNIDDDEGEDLQIINDRNIKPSYILKILYILYHEKKLIPSFSKETNKLFEYFTNKKETLFFDDSKKEINISSQKKNMNEIINSFEILLDSFKNSKININAINNLISEVSNTIQHLKSYEFIYIPFLGPSSSGKSTLINGIIGKDILPTNFGGCTKRGIIIRYSNSDETIIRKAYFKELKSFQKTFYYFEQDNIIGKGIDQVKETLKSLNYDFTDKIDDYFYYISTKIKLFDDMGLDDYQKNMIQLIDFPGFDPKNILKKEINKFMSIFNFFILVYEYEIKDSDSQELLNQIFTQAKKEKTKLPSQFAKSILFVLNKSKNNTYIDIDKAKQDIQNIIYGLDRDSINICFCNAKYYSEYCSNLNYFFDLKNLFAKELKNYSFYNNFIYINPEKSKCQIYKTFLEYFSKLLIVKIKNIGFIVKSNQKIDENVKREIDEIFNEFSELNKFGNDSKNKDIIIKLISFMRENINNLKYFKESNFKGFKNLFSLQIYFSYEDIQRNLIRKIDEITSKLDIFFRTNFFNKMKQIIEDLNKNLKPNQKQFIIIRDTFNTYITNLFKRRKDNLDQLLESKNRDDILGEINIEIGKHLEELFGNIKNYLDTYNKKIFNSHNEANNSIRDFFDGKENLPKFIKIFDNIHYYDEKEFETAPDDILNEIRAKECPNAILEKKGYLHAFNPFFIGMTHYQFLMNIFDIIKDYSIKQCNFRISVYMKGYERYINNYVKLIYKKVSIIQLNNKKDFDILSNIYKDIRRNIFIIKFRIKDELYTKTLINP